MSYPFSIPLASQEAAPIPSTGLDHEPQVRSPAEVDITLPKVPADEVAVPASINGRDLSLGQP